MMATRSQTAWASSIEWVVSRMLPPSARIRSIRAHRCRRDWGSSPVVGSSRSKRVGLVDHRHEEREPLLLAARDLLGGPVQLAAETDVGQGPVQFLVAHGHAVEAGVETGHLAHGQLGLEAGGLQLHSHLGLGQGGLADDVDPVEKDGARARPAQPLDGTERGGLAGPVRAEQTEDLASADLEAHPVNGHLRPVGDREVADLEERGAVRGRRRGHRPDGVDRRARCEGPGAAFAL